MNPTFAKERRQKLFLLQSAFFEWHKDLVATTLGWMCKEKAILFDVYLSAPQQAGFFALHDAPVPLQGGGLFSVYGSTLIGGRHHQAIAHALAQFETTVIRLGNLHVMESTFRGGARQVLDAPPRLVDLYVMCADELGIRFPDTVVAYQLKDLPAMLQYGYTQYTYPEAVYRKALALPLELAPDEIRKLADLGVKQIYSVATTSADTNAWRQAGLTVHAADVLQADENYDTLCRRMAERWMDRVTAVDLCEPILASYWLPFSIREDRLQVCGTRMNAICEWMAPLAVQKNQKMVYGRYAGGPVGGARNDEELFPLFQNNIPFQVIEPGRPVLRVLSAEPQMLPQPAQTMFDLAPSDAQLYAWAKMGRILTTLVFHSGEMSHNDAYYNVMDLSATTNIHVGIGVQSPRYAFEPECVEPMHTPIDQGGVMGLCEPVLHSGGYGIIAESWGDPQKIAALMKSARDDIAKISGERFAPRGVYCYLDAVPGEWRKKPERLWNAIAEAGFEYVISSVAQGENQVLYRQGNFVVLNMWYCNHYPYSPFVRITTKDQLAEMERRMSGTGLPGWIIGVIDTPIFAYNNYMTQGESNPSLTKPGTFAGVQLGKIFNFIKNRGETDKLVTATPFTIARYARILQENQFMTGI